MSIPKLTKTDKGLIALALVVLVVSYVFIGIHQEAKLTSDTPKAVDYQSSLTAGRYNPRPENVNLTDLYNLTNKDRTDRGILPLALNSDLTASASDKCSDMANRGYYAHSDPDGNLWTTILQRHVPNYALAAENIDATFQVETAPKINAVFMNSESHRNDILNPDYTDVGFAVCGGTYEGNQTVFVVEHFIKRYNPPAVQYLPVPHIPSCVEYNYNIVPSVMCY